MEKRGGRLPGGARFDIRRKGPGNRRNEAGPLAGRADGDLTAGDPAHGNPTEGDPTAGDPDRDASVGAALQALAVALRRGAVTFTVETVDARPATASPIAARLREAGFAAVPRGFRWRG